ncbi:MAG: DUF432 domain-containing protein [Alkalimonas sp.]|nr:DUF432 domain-containing protein [Alkalimonas sp.]
MEPTELAPLAPQTLTNWWQPCTMLTDQCWHLAIGPLSLYIERNQGEWLLGHQRHADQEELHRVLQEQLDSWPESITSSRYVFKQSPSQYQLLPCLMDRPVVVKTRQPVFIPPGESISFYLSTPVCIRLILGNDLTLLELPVLRLSDTWFGPSTQIGELCYAAKTHARHNLAELPLRPHRAVTPLKVTNRSGEMLSIGKISLPVPMLSVFAREDHTLWTEAVTLEHHSDQLLAKLKIERKLPEGIRAAQRVTTARQRPESHTLVRAFTGIFSD